jgi:hypothetical protein
VGFGAGARARKLDRKNVRRRGLGTSTVAGRQMSRKMVFAEISAVTAIWFCSIVTFLL